ncbi:hypothetical protein Mal64_39300 [Pseudobythopirellula maris]|uniref:VWFA domain-containing protein n=1 Tax=Pseudobythopirellula maris TaxID=2527991 RepID=A0A5C5ZFG0_9BACT|nr:vWA domain-containing protein [Pseudobythopirellula maris]TWT86189.1 hypothetical protein Mal64_39300 [Pseudobythopirellula maris]
MKDSPPTPPTLAPTAPPVGASAESAAGDLATEPAADHRSIGDALSWLLSLVLHVVALAALAAPTFPTTRDTIVSLLTTPLPPEEQTPLDDLRFADDPQTDIGAMGSGGWGEAAAAAPVLDLTSEVRVELEPMDEWGDVLAHRVETPVAVAPDANADLRIQGLGAVGVSGAAGAVDRLTHEILLSLDSAPTLVVWLFDRSGSLAPRREAFAKRFDRVYDELGVIENSANPAFEKADDKPLLTTVAAYGAAYETLTAEPTDDIAEIKSAVRSIADDPSGEENVFSAVLEAVREHRRHRLSKPRRHVMVIVVTDEAGDDDARLDEAVSYCRKMRTPVYVVGSPAPFGRRDAYVRYVDPNPRYDQRVQWLPVRQGPESWTPERVRLGVFERRGDPTIDSGFGPYGLTRLSFETGGAYYSVHPGRQRAGDDNDEDEGGMASVISAFFDDRLMRRYRPDYAPTEELKRRLGANSAREALVRAASLSWTEPLGEARLVFSKLSDAQLADDMTRAQRAAAIVEPQLERLTSILAEGRKDRERLREARWQAGYDLAVGRVLAEKARAEGYNAMLARAKAGMTLEAGNDTWILRPDPEVDSAAEQADAAAAAEHLQRVVREHPGTPWAYVAERELRRPMGWRWEQAFRDVAGRVAQARNGRPRPQRDAPPERRPPPKL